MSKEVSGRVCLAWGAPNLGFLFPGKKELRGIGCCWCCVRIGECFGKRKGGRGRIGIDKDDDVDDDD